MRSVKTLPAFFWLSVAMVLFFGSLVFMHVSKGNTLGVYMGSICILIWGVNVVRTAKRKP